MYHWGNSCDAKEHCSSNNFALMQSQKQSYNSFPFSLLICPWYCIDLPCCFTFDIRLACGTTTSEQRDVGSAANESTDSVDYSLSPHSPVVRTGRFKRVVAACCTWEMDVEEAKLMYAKRPQQFCSQAPTSTYSSSSIRSLHFRKRWTTTDTPPLSLDMRPRWWDQNTEVSR